MRDPQAALTPAAFTVIAESADRTEALGQAWGRVLGGGDVLLLEGDLGAGKTTLVRGLARGLDVPGGVKSPTFVIHLRYQGRLVLDHVDLYRVGAAADVAELGLDDLFAPDAVCVVEWGSRLGDAAPPHAIRVRFTEPDPETRRITVFGERTRVEPLARAVGAMMDDAGSPA